MVEMGTIERIDPHVVWPHEAHDFTPWLAENIDLLGAALGMDLELQSSEAPVGSFSLDILAHDLGSDRPVIIENQLESTNHDHLGKLLTYAAGYDAYAAVWLVRDFRDEHRQALDWLNQRTGEDTAFFGVVVEAIKIDGSRPAPQFRVVCMPNDWQKQAAGTGRAGAIAGNVSERGKRYREFLQDLVGTLQEQGSHWGGGKVWPKSYRDFPSGFGGIWYCGAFMQGGKKVKAEISIDRGDAAWNKRLFDSLREREETIQSQLPEPLVWYHTDDVNACRIRVERDGSIYDDPDRLAELHDWMVERLLKFREVFPRHLQELV